MALHWPRWTGFDDLCWLASPITNIDINIVDHRIIILIILIILLSLSYWLSSWLSFSVLRTWRRAGSWVSTNVSSPTFWWASTGKAAVYDLLRSKPHFRCLSNLSEGTFDFINLAQEVQWCCRSFFSAWQVGDQTANTLLYVFSLFFFYTRHQIWWRRSHWS